MIVWGGSLQSCRWSKPNYTSESRPFIAAVMFNTFMVASGLCWTLTYILIIRQGFRERTYGMPLAALAANLSWEFIFTLVHPHGFPQVAVNAIWLGFDLVIVWQLLQFGPAEWRWPRWLFTLTFVGALSLAFPLILLITYEFAATDKMSGAYAAFGQNLMMSILFIAWLRFRGTRGQSTAIALAKLLGTLLASVGFLLFTALGKSPLMIFLFAAIAAVDLKYLMLLQSGWRPRSLSSCSCPCCLAHEADSVPLGVTQNLVNGLGELNSSPLQGSGEAGVG